MRKTASDYTGFDRGERASDSPRISASLPVAQLRRYVKQWILDGQIRGLTAKSIRERRDVTDKLFWLADQEEWAEIGGPETTAFLAHVRAGHREPGGRWGAAERDPRCGKEPSAATLMAYFRQIRSLANWLVEEGAVAGSILGRRKPPLARNHQVTPFSEEQVEKLLAAARNSKCPERDYALVLLLCDTGARSQEVCGLEVGDLDLSSRRVTLRAAKGGKSRSVFCGKRTTKALYALLQNAPQPEGEKTPVFLADRGRQSGERLTTNGLGQVIRRLGKEAKLQGIRCSPHTFRHFYSIQFLRAGGNLFSLQQALGHTSLQMVKRYVAWAEADLERQSRQFSPADRLGRQ